MSSSLSDSALEKKFQGVTNTQDSIQTLSLWLLHHKSHHQKIVSAWMKVLQKAKITHRLTLFYLANDVIQNSKRKGFLLFVNSFAEVLKEATVLVKDEQIRPNVQRVFNIWEQRNVYSADFIADLQAILANSKVPSTAPSKLLANFKPDMVIKKMKSLLKIEMEATSKNSSINFSKLNATESEIVQQFKDRIHGQQFSRDFNKSIRQLEELVEIKTKEVNERHELILLLEQSGIYYDTQRGEAKIVANAYKNFDGRVKTLQKKLAELSDSFPSPLPSPSVDAPSPTNSDLEVELDLPTDNASEKPPESLEDAPSPVGSPEGLNLSPAVTENEKTAHPSIAASVGNPIPTLSNFFTHGQGGMTSLLGAFTSKKEKSNVSSAAEDSKGDAGSLDNRLSNLLQNIPNLPPGLQNTLFGSGASVNTSLGDIGSPVKGRKEKSDSGISIGSLTPVKDECSGQNTPLQDEDTHSNHAFFSKLASNVKQQSPKDILKGLTNLIHSASGDKEDTSKKEKLNSNDHYEQPMGMPSFLKNIIPAISRSPQLSPSYLPTATASSFQSVPTTTSTYQTATYTTQTSDQDMGFIPSLVPLTSQDKFDFPTEGFHSEEYNPEMEMFNTDMDIEGESGSDDVPSPEIEPLSPVQAASVDNEMPRSGPPARRLSTLITVVTEESPDDGTPPDAFYKSDKENVTQDSIQTWTHMEPPPVKNPPCEEFFLEKQEPHVPSYFTAPPPPLGPPNGENVRFHMEPLSPDCPLPRTRTFHPHQEDVNGRWFPDTNSNWVEGGRGPPPIPYGPPPDDRFFNRDNFSPPFPPHHQDWPPLQGPNHSFHQKRGPSYNHRPYGPPQNKRFPFRGRGWGRNPQY